MSLDGFNDNLNVVVIGASGGIGNALVHLLLEHHNVKIVHALSRQPITIQHPKLRTAALDLKDESLIEQAAIQVSSDAPLDIVITATGFLHNHNIKPEKSLRDINANSFNEALAVNTIGPALVMKHFLSKLNRDRKAVFAVMSARVGSISDNHLGGWYAYRASKTALNMLIKTASIEVARKYKKASVIGLHPGTVDTGLSEPFQSNVAKSKLFTPEFSAHKLIEIINNTEPEKTGEIFAWNGEKIPA